MRTTLPGPVDIHGHYVIPALLKGVMGTEGWRYERDVDTDGTIMLRRGSDNVPCFYEPIDLERIIENMDKLGISVMAINVAPFQMGYELDAATGAEIARIANDTLAEACATHPTRLVGMGTLPLQDVAAAIAELERVTSAGMAGVQLGSNVNGVYLGDQSLRPVWQAIADIGAAVFVHPLNVLGSERLGAYFLANLIGNPVDSTRSIADVIFSGLLSELPRLKVCFAHAGGAAPYLLGRWDHGFEKRRSARGHMDRPPSDYLKLLYFDHISHSGAALKFLVDLVGPGHVMVGTDYPFDMGPDDPVGFIDDVPDISTREREMILSSNAREFLGLAT
jgi:aminocarboxymuconate-semialdehyde decarboxylase